MKIILRLVVGLGAIFLVSAEERSASDLGYFHSQSDSPTNPLSDYSLSTRLTEPFKWEGIILHGWRAKSVLRDGEINVPALELLITRQSTKGWLTVNAGDTVFGYGFHGLAPRKSSSDYRERTFMFTRPTGKSETLVLTSLGTYFPKAYLKK